MPRRLFAEPIERAAAPAPAPSPERDLAPFGWKPGLASYTCDWCCGDTQGEVFGTVPEPLRCKTCATAHAIAAEAQAIVAGLEGNSTHGDAMQTRVLAHMQMSVDYRPLATVTFDEPLPAGALMRVDTPWPQPTPEQAAAFVAAFSVGCDDESEE